MKLLKNNQLLKSRNLSSLFCYKVVFDLRTNMLKDLNELTQNVTNNYMKTDQYDNVDNDIVNNETTRPNLSSTPNILQLEDIKQVSSSSSISVEKNNSLLNDEHHIFLLTEMTRRNQVDLSNAYGAIVKAFPTTLQQDNSVNQNIPLIENSATEKEEFYISSQEITRSIVGFFDLVPTIGRFYIFMCSKSTFGKKKQYKVNYQVFEKDNLCDLNYGLIVDLYSSYTGKNSRDLIQITDLMNFEQKVLTKYNKSRLKIILNSKNILPSLKDHELFFFKLLDPELQIWTETLWFKNLFKNCNYFKEKFISEIETLYSENVIKILKICTNEELYKFFILIGEKSKNLLFFDKLPTEIKLLALATGKQYHITVLQTFFNVFLFYAAILL